MTAATILQSLPVKIFSLNCKEGEKQNAMLYVIEVRKTLC